MSKAEKPSTTSEELQRIIQTPAFQARHDRAMEDLKEGRFVEIGNAEELDAAVEQERNARKSQRGEIRVGEAGGLAFIAGLFVVSEGVNKNSIPEIAIGGTISLAVLLEAIVMSLRKPKV